MSRDRLELLYLDGLTIERLNNLVKNFEEKGYENFTIEEIEDDYSCRSGWEYGKSYFLFGEKVDSKNKYFLEHLSFPVIPIKIFNSKQDLLNHLHNYVGHYKELIDSYSLFYGESLKSAKEIEFDWKITFIIGD